MNRNEFKGNYTCLQEISYCIVPIPKPFHEAFLKVAEKTNTALIQNLQIQNSMYCRVTLDVLFLLIDEAIYTSQANAIDDVLMSLLNRFHTLF